MCSLIKKSIPAHKVTWTQWPSVPPKRSCQSVDLVLPSWMPRTRVSYSVKVLSARPFFETKSDLAMRRKICLINLVNYWQTHICLWEQKLETTARLWHSSIGTECVAIIIVMFWLFTLFKFALLTSDEDTRLLYCYN